MSGRGRSPNGSARSTAVRPACPHPSRTHRSTRGNRAPTTGARTARRWAHERPPYRPRTRAVRGVQGPATRYRHPYAQPRPVQGCRDLCRGPSAGGAATHLRRGLSQLWRRQRAGVPARRGPHRLARRDGDDADRPRGRALGCDIRRRISEQRRLPRNGHRPGVSRGGETPTGGGRNLASDPLHRESVSGRDSFQLTKRYPLTLFIRAFLTNIGHSLTDIKGVLAMILRGKWLVAGLLMAAAPLAGCRDNPDAKAELSPLDDGLTNADPAIKGSLEDKIMVDPKLTGQANQNAVTPGNKPVDGGVPAVAGAKA